MYTIQKLVHAIVAMSAAVIPHNIGQASQVVHVCASKPKVVTQKPNIGI